MKIVKFGEWRLDEETQAMMNTIATHEKFSVTSNLATNSVAATSARPLAAPSLEGANADVLVELRANLAQLEDLHGRLKHLMSELSYLLRKPEY